MSKLKEVRLKTFVSAWSLGVSVPDDLDDPAAECEKSLGIPYVYLAEEREFYFDIAQLVKFLSPHKKVGSQLHNNLLINAPVAAVSSPGLHCAEGSFWI